MNENTDEQVPSELMKDVTEETTEVTSESTTPNIDASESQKKKRKRSEVNKQKRIKKLKQKKLESAKYRVLNVVFTESHKLFTITKETIKEMFPDCITISRNDRRFVRVAFAKESECLKYCRDEKKKMRKRVVEKNKDQPVVEEEEVDKSKIRMEKVIKGYHVKLHPEKMNDIVKPVWNDSIKQYADNVLCIMLDKNDKEMSREVFLKYFPTATKATKRARQVLTYFETEEDLSKCLKLCQKSNKYEVDGHVFFLRRASESQMKEKKDDWSPIPHFEAKDGEEVKETKETKQKKKPKRKKQKKESKQEETKEQEQEETKEQE